MIGDLGLGEPAHSELHVHSLQQVQLFRRVQVLFTADSLKSN
jgi:hypothetical protein